MRMSIVDRVNVTELYQNVLLKVRARDVPILCINVGIRSK